MVYFSFTTILLSVLTTSIIRINASPSNNWDPSKVKYPVARRANTSFDYESLLPNGTIVNVTVADPYNWLEEDVTESNETKAFVEAEMALTQSYLDKNKDYDAIYRSLAHFDEYLGIGRIRPFGPENEKKYLYKVSPINSSRPIWYLATKEEMEKGFQTQFNSSPFPLPGTPWFDENLLNKDGLDSIVDFYPSPDGQLIAYAVTSGGGDNSTIYVRSINSPLINQSTLSNSISGGAGRLEDVIPFYATEGLGWHSNSSGFFYANEEETSDQNGYNSKVRYHSIGTKYEEDLIILDAPKDNQQSWMLFISADKKWVIVMLQKGLDLHNAVYVAPLDQPISNKMKWISITSELSSVMFYVGNVDSTFFFISDSDQAYNYKIVSVVVDKSKAKSVQPITKLTDKLLTKVVVPERTDAKFNLYRLQDDNLSPVFDSDKLLMYYTKNGTDEAFVFQLQKEGLLRATNLFPQGGLGNIINIYTNLVYNEIFLFTTTINKPTTIYRISYDPIKIQFQAPIIFDASVKGFDLNEIVSDHHYSISKDGTKIPFTLFYKNGTNFDGNNPALIYFYGAYGINILPSYTPRYLDWIFHYGGIISWAAPRGGGENGGEWHIGGKRKKRQNTVDDVISVANYLVKNQISSNGKVIVSGSSAAASTCMVIVNQAQEGLLGGALCDRGQYDMLRFPEIDGNEADIPEYGDPRNASDFHFIYDFSPLQHVNKTKQYPLVLLSAGQNDDRVPPTYSYKMIAELRNDLPNNTNPLLLYISQGVGHTGTPFSRTQYLTEFSAKAAILVEGLGLVRKS